MAHFLLQARRAPYVWGLGWSSSSSPPESSHATVVALAATPVGGGGGEWGAGSGIAGGGGAAGAGAGGMRGRGGRGSSESSAAGAREAHAYAEAAAAAAVAPVAADEEDRDSSSDRFVGMDRPEDKAGGGVLSTIQDFPRIVEALSCYKSVHGHLRMIPAFRVPPNVPWPEALWGMDLGRMVSGRIRRSLDVWSRAYYVF